MPANMDKEEEATKNKARLCLAAAETGIEKLRYQCLLRGCSGIKGIARAFRIADDNGDKKICFEEFEELLKDYGLDICTEEAKEIFQQFDNDGSGCLSFDEFLTSLRPPLSEPRLKIIKQCFTIMDKTGDGVITIEDLKESYCTKEHPKYLNGEMDENQIFKQFLGKFGDADDDGKVTLEEFINYYSGVSVSIDSDVYFDLMMRSAFKIEKAKRKC